MLHRAKKQRITCLIVEREGPDRDRMAAILTRSFRNVDVEIAPSLRSARRILDALDVSLILLDNDLPDGVGVNFALEISKQPHLAHIPVILVSDWSSPFMGAKAVAAGVLFMVSKADFGARYLREALRQSGQARRVS